MKRIHRIMFFLGMASLASAFVILFVSAFWLLYPYQPITVKQPAKVLSTSVVAHDNIVFIVDYCKNINAHAKVTLSFINDVEFYVPTFETNNPPGCHVTQVTREVPILPPGEYKIHMTYEYKVNPLRRIFYSFDTESFTIHD